MGDGPTSIYIGNGVKYDGRLMETTSPAPAFGDHNGYVFGDLLGFSAAEIKELEEPQVALNALPEMVRE